MKHIIFYVTVMVLFATMMMIIIQHQEPKAGVLLTVETDHSYLYDDAKQFEMVFYINDINHPLANIESYQVVEVSDANQTKRLEMTLTDLVMGHHELYLNDDYQSIILYFDLPNLTSTFYIDTAYLDVELINGDQYHLRIGNFEIFYQDGQSDAFNWTALEGKKDPTTYLCRLDVIRITFDQLDLDISSVYIGGHLELSFAIEDDQLVLSIPKEDRLLYDVPIVITFIDQSVTTIANFRYVRDYQILKESGMLIHSYALN